MSTDHPCGSLPVSGWHLSVWYCHRHQAWFGTCSEWLEDAPDDPRPFRDASFAFGPFDSFTDVSRWMSAQAADVWSIPRRHVSARDQLGLADAEQPPLPF